MKIAVCCKFAPDAEDVRVADDGSVDVSKAKWSVSDYDMQAIQAASDLGGELGAEVVALTAGPAKIDQAGLRKTSCPAGTCRRCFASSTMRRPAPTPFKPRACFAGS